MTQACKDHAKTHSHMPCNVWVWCGKSHVTSRGVLWHIAGTGQDDARLEEHLHLNNTRWPSGTTLVAHVAHV